MPDERQLKVLYIGGQGRSGSTLIGNLVGQIEGVFFGGELYYIWDRALIKNRLVGNGVPFRDNQLWQAVFEEGFGGFAGVDPKIVVGWRQAGRFTSSYLRGRRLRGRTPEPTTQFLRLVERLYHAIGSVTGCRVIVDSSHSPSYAKRLSSLSSIDVRMLHLTRDARGVAYSWTKKRPQQARFHPATSAALWMEFNVAMELVGRSTTHSRRVRYEDFVARPQQFLRDILVFLEEREQSFPFLDDQTVYLERNHSVSGNPNRLRHGAIKLRLDQEWRTRLPWRHKAMVNAIAWPLLLHYGYLRSSVSRILSDS